MRATLGCAVVAVLAVGTGLLAADKKDEKVDAKALLGKWELNGLAGKGVSKVAEFAKDGKAVFTDTVNGNETKTEGTYKVDGDKLIVTATVKGKERTVTSIITKTTEAEIVLTDEKGFEMTYSRLKDK